MMADKDKASIMSIYYIRVHHLLLAGDWDFATNNLLRPVVSIIIRRNSQKIPTSKKFFNVLHLGGVDARRCLIDYYTFFGVCNDNRGSEKTANSKHLCTKQEWKVP
ncbi:hypothetical protein GCK32_000196 [Trichostrongylus colubriformis]|uniref:Uncharacterized protein n=1 Tax=Trichostrongylus colubriformis TaxID=6319 RepID=A0AAN8F8U0_TRICO